MNGAALVVADGRKAKYGITACLGALEDLPPGRYPAVHWPATGELAATLARLRGEGVRPVVLWSAFSPEFDEVAARLTRVRAEVAESRAGASAPGPTLHVVGGPHPSADAAACARGGFDLVAAGEGELTMRALVQALAEDPGVSTAALAGIDGLARLDADGVLARSPGRALAALDDAPSFAMRQRRIGPIEITRGCIYACRFCHTPYVFTARFRHRSVESVRAHVRDMLSLGKRHVRFLTPSALSYGATGGEVDLDAVARLLSGVRAELPPDGRIYFGTFPSELRPEHVTVEALRLIRRWCDNDNVILGAQSGSDAVLAAAHRGHDVASVHAAVEACAEVGLVANVDVILGMPGESEADAAATLTLCRDLVGLGARIHAHTFLPLPGTPWRDAPAPTIDPEVVAELGRLAAQGRAYGAWQQQAGLAGRLAETAGQAPRRRR